MNDAVIIFATFCLTVTVNIIVLALSEYSKAKLTAEVKTDKAKINVKVNAEDIKK